MACQWRAVAESLSTVMAEALSILMRAGRGADGAAYFVGSGTEIDNLVRRAIAVEADAKSIGCPCEDGGNE